MTIKYLAKFAALLIQQKAIEAVLDDMRPATLRLLKNIPDRQYDALGVKFNVGASSKVRYTGNIGKIIAKLKSDLKSRQENAVRMGKVVKTTKKTLVAEIPRSIQKDLFREVPQYARHFGVRKIK